MTASAVTVIFIVLVVAIAAKRSRMNR